MRPGARGVVLVATPIGNLGDLSPRAADTLRAADIVYCEDTRRTRALLSAAGIPGAGRLRSLHAHNEEARIPELVAAAASGQTVAVVSDAGMPAISDPGARLVAAAASAGIEVSVVPGPSAVLSALVVSGLPTDRFCVEGFLPRSGGDRRRRLDALVDDARTTVVLESPRRLGATLSDLASRAPERPVAVCRELTKLHEEVVRATAAELAARYATQPPRGEIVLVVGPGSQSGGQAELDVALAALSKLIEAGAKPRAAAGVVASLTGHNANALYRALTERA